MNFKILQKGQKNKPTRNFVLIGLSKQKKTGLFV
jgi:hypothetical protein